MARNVISMAGRDLRRVAKTTHDNGKLPEAAIFYLVFTVVYGLMHALVYSQAAPLLPASGWSRPALALCLLALTLSPVATGSMGLRSGPAALAVYAWMGLVFYLFLGSVVLAGLRLVVGPGVHKVLFLALLGLSAAACAWGMVHARDVRLKRLVAPVPGMAAGAAPVRLAVVSDVHLYSVEQERRLDRILPLLDGMDYDVLVSLGDLVEGGFHEQDWAAPAARLAALRPRLGKYAVTGNHEYYADRSAGGPVAERFHEVAGFDVLDNRAVDAGGELVLAGVDYHEPRPGVVAGQARGLARSGGKRPVVLLKHVPEATPAMAGLADIQLSGHSHAGQMWPFTLFVRWRFPLLRGLYPQPGGGSIYVSEGTGTWGPPMRVGTQAEVTLVELVPAEMSAHSEPRVEVVR